MTSPAPLLTTVEVARRLAVSEETVRRYVGRGQLKAVVLPSGRFRFRPEDVAALLDAAA